MTRAEFDKLLKIVGPFTEQLDALRARVTELEKKNAKREASEQEVD